MLELFADHGLLSHVATFTWDLDPEAFGVGMLRFRYYGILFATGLMIGYGLLRWQFRVEGDDPDDAVRLTYWLILGVILGARLGHVFFYEADRYLAHPAEIIKFWKGGLASHGAAVGLAVVTAVYIYGFRKIPFRILGDRMAIAIPIATSCVRLGNFFNSEVVGRTTDASWAVIFLRYDPLPRHPSQLYEMTMGLVLFAIIYFTDRYYRVREKDRPLGLLVSIFVMGYFSMRFSVEFFKEFQTLTPDEGALTMGQYLSIPFFAAGAASLWATLWGPWKGQTARPYLEQERARKEAKAATKLHSKQVSTEASDSDAESKAAARSLARAEGKRRRPKGNKK